MHYNQVGVWRRRYGEFGVGGLVDEERPGRPPVYDHDDVMRLVTLITEPPPDGATRWTMEALAARMNEHGCADLGVAGVADLSSVGSQAVADPESWMTSHDPDFWEKAGDVCGLYLNPPENAVVWSVDEKSADASQVAGSTRPSRRGPGTPDAGATTATAVTAPRCCSPGSTCTTATSPAGSPTRPARRTSSSSSATSSRTPPPGSSCTASSTTSPPTAPRWSSVPRRAPARLLAQHPDPRVVAQPSRAVLLDPRTTPAAPRRVRPAVDELADRIIAFINDYNRHARPFRWTYDGRPLKVA